MKSIADKLGIFLSGLCAIQCAMLPIILSISAVVPNWAHFGHGWIWMTVIGVIALWSFSRGWQRHHDKRVIGLFALGFGFLVGGTLMEDQVDIIIESAMFVVGGVLMVLAHWRNYQLMKCIKPVGSEATR
ncbi:MAG: MerC domain-containing protein [Marinicella sp.]